jgi:hypothetical protein
VAFLHFSSMYFNLFQPLLITQFQINVHILDICKTAHYFLIPIISIMERMTFSPYKSRHSGYGFASPIHNTSAKTTIYTLDGCFINHHEISHSAVLIKELTS